MNRLFLYGPPGSGKTTLGKILAERLSVAFTDLDEAVETRTGRSIPAIFAEDGEAAFRKAEREALAETVADPSSRVVSLGGGTLLDGASRALAESAGTVFCLDADERELQRRIDASPGTRPLGNRLRERAAHYASFPNRVAAFFDLPGSLVVVGSGVRALAGCLRRKTQTVTDVHLAKAYQGELPPGTFAIPAGEETKTLDTVASIWNAFLAAGIGRDGAAVAFGGGVTGDMTGFAAATWMRGIPWINLPSSLLAMVDSSTGGKTGCDLPGAKNMVGAFHSPVLVAADVDVLGTLPVCEWRCGLAEAIKHAVIADPSLAGFLGRFAGLKDAEDRGGFSPACSQAELAQFVAKALAVKVQIVREDPFETTGSRARLNLGHTVGHAVETASGFTVRHGEAVAIGTVEEAKIAVRAGLAAPSLPGELADLFSSVGLPVSMPRGMTLESLMPIMARDKKNAAGRIRYALPCAMGNVRLASVP